MRTPKNPNDPRITITKQKITHALNQNLIENPSLSNCNFVVYHRAGVGQSTFFDHFKDLDEVMTLQKEAIRAEFKARLFKNLPQNSSYNKIFTFIAVFIMQHRDFYEATSRCGDYQPFEEIICLARKHLTATWPNNLKPSAKNRLYVFFTLDIESFFREWAQQSLNPKMSENIIHSFTYFARAFERNIFPIAHLTGQPHKAGQPHETQQSNKKESK